MLRRSNERRRDRTRNPAGTAQRLVRPPIAQSSNTSVLGSSLTSCFVRGSVDSSDAAA